MAGYLTSGEESKMAKLLNVLILLVLVSTILLVGCNGEEPVTPPTDTGEWQWPDRLHVSAAGSSGMVKYVSFLNLMEVDFATKIRVVPEASGVTRARTVKDGSMFMYTVGKSSLKNCIEAVEGYTARESGPFHTRSIWVHSMANSGVFVRGDSEIQTIYDIKPGHKWSVWDMSESVVRVPKAILDWVQIDHDDILWVNAGTTEGSVRAVAEGRSDITWFFPTSAAIFEAAAAPHGIRFLDLNSDEDPEGAARFRERGAMYVFGPIGTGTPEAIGVWGTMGYKYMVTREQTDEELVYQYAKWMDENFDRYKDTHSTNKSMSFEDLMASLENTYIPVHEGLKRYLVEKGVWTEAHERRQLQNVTFIAAYVDAYDAAIALADERGVKVEATRDEWLELWENYKLEIKLPVISMHQSLTEDASWVEMMGLGD
jgi:TRAP transporter TAXI family solute receptor